MSYAMRRQLVLHVSRGMRKASNILLAVTLCKFEPTRILQSYPKLRAFTGVYLNVLSTRCGVVDAMRSITDSWVWF